MRDCIHEEFFGTWLALGIVVSMIILAWYILLLFLFVRAKIWDGLLLMGKEDEHCSVYSMTNR